MDNQFVTNLDKIKEQLLFEELYDQGYKELNLARQAMEEYKQFKSISKFIKSQKHKVNRRIKK